MTNVAKVAKGEMVCVLDAVVDKSAAKHPRRARLISYPVSIERPTASELSLLASTPLSASFEPCC